MNDSNTSSRSAKEELAASQLSDAELEKVAGGGNGAGTGTMGYNELTTGEICRAAPSNTYVPNTNAGASATGKG